MELQVFAQNSLVPVRVVSVLRLTSSYRLGGSPVNRERTQHTGNGRDAVEVIAYPWGEMEQFH